MASHVKSRGRTLEKESRWRARTKASRPVLRRHAAFEIGLPGAFDPAASLEMFRRSGDDLLDRWDGKTFVRTIVAAGRTVGFSIGFAGTVARPLLRVVVENRKYAEPVEAAVRDTFLQPPDEFAQLRRADPIVARLNSCYRGLRPVMQLNLLGALIRCISAQQVNLRWACETRRRLAERLGDRHSVGDTVVYSFNPERLANAAVAEIRALQFTNRKAEYIVAVARALADNRISLARLTGMADEDVIAGLVALRGIGRWTAEWILARTMGRPRVVAGDLGVRKAVGVAYRAGAMPSEDDVRRLTAHWGRSAVHVQAMLLHALGEKRLDTIAGPL